MCTRLCQHDHITMTLVEDTQQRMELEKRPAAAAPSTTLEALLPGRAEEAPAANDVAMLEGAALAARPPEGAGPAADAGGDVPDNAGAAMIE